MQFEKQPFYNFTFDMYKKMQFFAMIAVYFLELTLVLVCHARRPDAHYRLIRHLTSSLTKDDCGVLMSTLANNVNSRRKRREINVDPGTYLPKYKKKYDGNLFILCFRIAR